MASRTGRTTERLDLDQRLKSCIATTRLIYTEHPAIAAPYTGLSGTFTIFTYLPCFFCRISCRIPAACAPAVAPVSLLSPAVLGYFFGKYMCLLVAVYGATGIVNLLVIYTPFFLVTFLSMTVAGARAARAVGCGRVRSSALVLLKVYGVNMAVDFVIFVLVGAFVKVIVVGF